MEKLKKIIRGDITKIKNPCKVCSKHVPKKRGLRCKGTCHSWIHFDCLSYVEAKIQAIKHGYLKISCPCPVCSSQNEDDINTFESVSCTVNKYDTFQDCSRIKEHTKRSKPGGPEINESKATAEMRMEGPKTTSLLPKKSNINLQNCADQWLTHATSPEKPSLPDPSIVAGLLESTRCQLELEPSRYGSPIKSAPTDLNVVTCLQENPCCHVERNYARTDSKEQFKKCNSSPTESETQESSIITETPNKSHCKPKCKFCHSSSTEQSPSVTKLAPSDPNVITSLIEKAFSKPKCKSCQHCYCTSSSKKCSSSDSNSNTDLPESTCYRLEYNSTHSTASCSKEVQKKSSVKKIKCTEANSPCCKKAKPQKTEKPQNQNCKAPSPKQQTKKPPPCCPTESTTVVTPKQQTKKPPPCSPTESTTAVTPKQQTKKPPPCCPTDSTPAETPKQTPDGTNSDQGLLSKSCSCVIKDKKPKKALRTSVSESFIMSNYNANQRVLQTTIERLCCTVGQLSNQLNCIISKLVAVMERDKICCSK